MTYEEAQKNLDAVREGRPVSSSAIRRSLWVTGDLRAPKNCEAREWISRHKTKIGEVGSVAARSWWLQVCDDIAKRRGPEALDDLRSRMNKEKANV
jgi:hypothetical protein